MTTIALDVTAPTGTRARWIESPGFDLTFFVLSPLIALPILIAAPAGDSWLALVFGAMLGAPHYLSTFAFFFWGETRQIHRTQWALFFGGPLLIVAVMTTAAFFRVPYLIQVAVYLWNTVHVARQNCGILSIYRHRAGTTAPRDKSVVNAAIVSTSIALAFWNIAWYPTMNRFLSFFWTGLPRFSGLATAMVAIVALARLARWLWSRFANGPRPSSAELAFLATSLLMFHPYLWIHDANRATLGMLLGHFLQYLALVWIVQRRRYPLRESATPEWLGRLSTSLPLLLAAIGVSGGAFLLLQVFADRDPTLQSVYEVGYLSLALVHFYLDGLFWAFRRPEVRQQLGPYVLGPRVVPAR